MFPLDVTLIGCRDGVQRNVLSMLIDQQANLEGRYADVDAVTAALRDEPGGPRCFILHVPDSSTLPKLRQLVGTFQGQPVLALVDAGLDPPVLLGAMRSGAAQVVPLPIQPDDFRQAMDCIGRQFGHPAESHQAVAVSGVTGGCGATALAVNLASEMAAAHGQQVILSELSLQAGKLAASLGLTPGRTTFGLLHEGDRLDPRTVRRSLTPVAERLHVLAGNYRAVTPVRASAAGVGRLVDSCRSLANVAVFDVPCTYDDLYFETLAVADQVVLVGEQKIPSIRTLKLVCEALARIDGAWKLHVVINRYDPRMPGFGADRLRSLLEVPELMTVCNDYAAVMASINRGRPLRLEAPRSPALADINKVVQVLLGSAEQPAGAGPGTPNGRKSGFGSFNRKLGLTT